MSLIETQPLVTKLIEAGVDVTDYGDTSIDILLPGVDCDYISRPYLGFSPNDFSADPLKIKRFLYGYYLECQQKMIPTFKSFINWLFEESEMEVEIMRSEEDELII